MKEKKEVKRGGDKNKGNNRRGGGEGGEVESTRTAFVARGRTVAVNDRGQRIGESHPRAVLTDHEVWLLLTLRDEGFSYGWLASKFEVSKSQVGRIVRGEKRAQLPARWKRV